MNGRSVCEEWGSGCYNLYNVHYWPFLLAFKSSSHSSTLSEHFCSDYSASVKSINKGPFFYNLMYNVHWDSVWPNVDGGSRRPGQETGYWAASQPERRRRRHAAGLRFFSPFFSLFHHKHLRLCFFSPSLELSVECTETFLLSHALSVPSKNLGNVSNEFWLLSSEACYTIQLQLCNWIVNIYSGLDYLQH